MNMMKEDYESASSDCRTIIFYKFSSTRLPILYCDVTRIEAKGKAVGSGKGVYTCKHVVALTMIISVTLVVRWSHRMLRRW